MSLTWIEPEDKLTIPYSLGYGSFPDSARSLQDMNFDYYVYICHLLKQNIEDEPQYIFGNTPYQEYKTHKINQKFQRSEVENIMKSNSEFFLEVLAYFSNAEENMDFLLEIPKDALKDQQDEEDYFYINSPAQSPHSPYEAREYTQVASILSLATLIIYYPKGQHRQYFNQNYPRESAKIFSNYPNQNYPREILREAKDPPDPKIDIYEEHEITQELCRNTSIMATYTELEDLSESGRNIPKFSNEKSGQKSTGKTQTLDNCDQNQENIAGNQYLNNKIDLRRSKSPKKDFGSSYILGILEESDPEDEFLNAPKKENTISCSNFRGQKLENTHLEKEKSNLNPLEGEKHELQGPKNKINMEITFDASLDLEKIFGLQRSDLGKHKSDLGSIQTNPGTHFFTMESPPISPTLPSSDLESFICNPGHPLRATIAHTYGMNVLEHANFDSLTSIPLSLTAEPNIFIDSAGFTHANGYIYGIADLASKAAILKFTVNGKTYEVPGKTYTQFLHCLENVETLEAFDAINGLPPDLPTYGTSARHQSITDRELSPKIDQHSDHADSANSEINADVSIGSNQTISTDYPTDPLSSPSTVHTPDTKRTPDSGNADDTSASARVYLAHVEGPPLPTPAHRPFLFSQLHNVFVNDAETFANESLMGSMVKWPCIFSFYYLFIKCRRH